MRASDIWTETGMARTEQRKSMTHSWELGVGGAVRLASSMAIRWLVEKERRDFWRLEDCKLEWVRILRSPSLLQPVWAVGT